MPDISSPAVEVLDLVKRYGQQQAVDGASFTAGAGAITAVLGPNGAGKTSTIECCEGLRRPDGGAVRVLGRDPFRDGDWLRPRVGVMLQGGGMPGAARAGDVLRLAAAMYAAPRDPAELVAALDLGGQLRTPIRRLSGGQQQRVALAVALVGRPRVVFLDEPTAGLDPQARLVVWDLIRELRDGGVAVLLSTHLLDEAERLADQVVLMAGGRVVAAGSPEQLTGGGGHTLSFDAAAGLDLSRLTPALSPGIAVTEVRPGRYVTAGTTGLTGSTGTGSTGTGSTGTGSTGTGSTGTGSTGSTGSAGSGPARLTPADVAAVTAWCAAQGLMPEGLSLGRRSLEDVFLEIAGRTRPGSADGPTDEPPPDPVATEGVDLPAVEGTAETGTDRRATATSTSGATAETSGPTTVVSR